MIHAALSSAAFLGSSADEVLFAACEAGVTAVEWSSDGFLDPGDRATALRLMESTLRTGLCISSYSTLHRIGTYNLVGFDTLVHTALALQAPNIRAWAAPPGDDGACDRFVEAAKAAGDAAGGNGITLCLAMSPRSLLRWDGRAADLMARVDHPFVKLCWEPPCDRCFDRAMETLEGLSGHVGMIMRRPYPPFDDGLESRQEDWLEYLDAVDEQGGSPDMVRYVVIRSYGPHDAPRLAGEVRQIKRMNEMLRRYHRRRVFKT